MRYKKIGVFLSSKSNISKCYLDTTQEMGRLIGRNGGTLVYGGANCGAMEVLAKSVKESGGKVFGVVPDILVKNDRVSDYIDITFRCVDLNDRKAILMRESDVIVALPGGIGTLDEAFTVMGAATIGIEWKPLIFLNINGCWDNLFMALENLREQGFISCQLSCLYQVAISVKELEEML